MMLRAELTMRMYVSRPWPHWAFGTFIAALLIMFFVLAFREGVRLLVWHAWPAYAVTAIFLPIALLMLSARAIDCRIDPVSREVVITRYRLMGRGIADRVAITAIQSVEVVCIETNDGDVYAVEILTDDGRRYRVTATQIASRARAEAIAAQMRQRISAERVTPV